MELVPPGGSSSRDIASKVLPDTKTRTPTDCRLGRWKVFPDRTRYRQLFTEENLLLRPVEPAQEEEEGGVEKR